MGNNPLEGIFVLNLMIATVVAHVALWKWIIDLLKVWGWF